MQAVVTFDQLLPEVLRFVESRAQQLAGLGRLVIIRDLWGRVRLLAPRLPTDEQAAAALDGLARDLETRLGRHAHAAGESVLYEDRLALDAARLLGTPTVRRKFGELEVALFDRQVTGMSWATEAVEDAHPEHPERLTFFSIKGGVGRSTAAAVAAWHLARQGYRVLVADFDLESLGLSTSLLPRDCQPKFGIVDWFVEDLVGQGDVVLDALTAPSPLAAALDGEIRVVPSHGVETGEYLAKLGRCYLDLPGSSPGYGPGDRSWVARLQRLLNALEKEHKPDVVLLDSRAGLHDIASTLVTAVGAQVLLFGVGTDQTWQSYRILFEHWKRAIEQGAGSALRERLKMVAAMVPETGRRQYLESFLENSWSLFLDTLYDEGASGEHAAFSFDLGETAAPHSPLEVYWNRDFASLARFDEFAPSLVDSAFGRFLEGIEPLLPPRSGELSTAATTRTQARE